MQAGKSAVASAKETASNIAASAQSGLDKTKATVQEKRERMTAHDPVEKEMATERKYDKINQAEMNKQQAREHNAAAKQQLAGGASAGFVGGTHTPGAGTGMNQMSAMPGHGTGQPAGNVVPGSGQAHPVGVNAGTGRTTGGETNQGYGTGGSFA